MELIDKLRMWSILRLKRDGIYVPSIEYDFWNKNLELMKLEDDEFENESTFET